MEKKKYRLLPGHKHYIGRTRFDNEAIIDLYPHQAVSIRDKLVEVGTGEEPDPDPVSESTAPAFEIKHVGGGRFNVLHPETGEKMNDSLLSREEAVEMAEGGNPNRNDQDAYEDTDEDDED